MWEAPPNINTEVATQIGICRCSVYCTKWQDVYEVVFSKSIKYKDGAITEFCGGRHFKRDGERYIIIRRKPTEYANELWFELEQIGSNLILLNT